MRLVRAGADQVAGDDGEVGARGPGVGRDHRRDRRVALGVADHDEGVGVVLAAGRAHGQQRRLEALLLVVDALDLPEVGRARLEAVDADLVHERVALGRHRLQVLGVGAEVHDAARRPRRLPHDRDAVLGDELLVGRDQELEFVRVVAHRRQRRQLLAVVELLGDLLRGRREVEYRDFADAAVVAVVFVAVLVRADRDHRFVGPEHFARLRLAGGVELAVDVEPHLGAVEGGDDVVEPAELEARLALEIGHVAVAVVGAGAGQAEREGVLVVAEHGTLLGVAVVLHQREHAAPALRGLDRDPGRDRQVLLGQDLAQFVELRGRDQRRHAVEVHRLAVFVAEQFRVALERRVGAEARLQDVFSEP